MITETRIPIPLNLRPASYQDAPGILEVHLTSIRQIASRDYTPKQISGWSDPLSAETYTRAMSTQGEKIFVAERDGKIVGFSSIQGDQVKAVYVAPDAAGAGVGRALYEVLEADARVSGVRSLELYSSITARLFYEKQGFRFEKECLLKLASGAELRCFLMRKHLVRAYS